MKEYIQSCDICFSAKMTHHQHYRLLQPLPISNGPWLSLFLDFITDLLVSCTFDSILVVVDKLTKMAHFIPCNKTIIGERTTKLLINHIYHYHSQLEDIMSDWRSQFISKFWKEFFELLHVKINPLSGYHLESNG